jgi:hypothetical protein
MRLVMLSFIFGVLIIGYLNQVDNASLSETARSDLASRLNIPANEIEVVSVEPVNWPDTCLGVYHPGQACAAVMTPGWRIVLHARGLDYYYNSSETELVFAD